MSSENKGSRKKALRELAGIGQKREMEQALSELQAKFMAWRSGSLSCFELNDAIHDYHDHTARDIWKRYSYCKPEQIVPILVAEGILEESDLHPELLEKFRQVIDNWRQEIERIKSQPAVSSEG